MTLDDFVTRARAALKDNPGAEGREMVCALVRDALADPAFVAKHRPVTA